MVHKEDAGSLDPKTKVLPLGQYAYRYPSKNHLIKLKIKNDSITLTITNDYWWFRVNIFWNAMLLAQKLNRESWIQEVQHLRSKIYIVAKNGDIIFEITTQSGERIEIQNHVSQS